MVTSAVLSLLINPICQGTAVSYILRPMAWHGMAWQPRWKVLVVLAAGMVGVALHPFCLLPRYGGFLELTEIKPIQYLA